MVRVRLSPFRLEAAMKYIVNVDVLDGDVTVQVTITLTTRVLGSRGEDHALARREAEAIILAAVREAAEKSHDNLL
jgi:hypothetical protein